MSTDTRQEPLDTINAEITDAFEDLSGPSISETAQGRDHYTRQGQLDQIVDARESDIRFMNLVLSVCALPRRSMGHQRQWSRRETLKVPWRELYEQVGSEPNRRGTKDVSRFRANAIRELKKLKNVWPELRYRIRPGTLEKDGIWCCRQIRPRIPPTDDRDPQRRLIE